MALDISSYLLGKSKSGGGGGVDDYFDTKLYAGNVNVSGIAKSIKKLPANMTVDGNSLAYTFKGYDGEVPNIDTINVTSLLFCFQYCSISSAPNWDTSNVTNMEGCFQLSSLETAPSWNTSKVTTFRSCFNGCSLLKNLPVYNWSSATDFGQMLVGVGSLTDTSLDNLLQSCISATSYSGTKTLNKLGLNYYLYGESKIQSLPHYQDFIDAGWTIS